MLFSRLICTTYSPFPVDEKPTPYPVTTPPPTGDAGAPPSYGATEGAQPVRVVYVQSKVMYYTLQLKPYATPPQGACLNGCLSSRCSPAVALQLRTTSPSPSLPSCAASGRLDCSLFSSLWRYMLCCSQKGTECGKPNLKDQKLHIDPNISFSVQHALQYSCCMEQSWQLEVTLFMNLLRKYNAVYT